MKLTVKYKPTAALVANPRNARYHSKEQVSAIAASMKEFGFTNPILLDADDVVIAGHGRLEAAKSIGLEQVPTINLGYLTEAQRRAYAIADNKIPLAATWDFEMLKVELDALDTIGFDLTLTGFDTSELDRLLASDGLLPNFTPPNPPLAENALGREGASGPSNSDGELDDEGDGEELKEPAPIAPKGSDADYSVFELVMLHENKMLLVNTLSELRINRHYEKLEDALMHLIRAYNEGKLDA